jgi:glycosyltransferase involved in cell wall biosynthesis
MQMPLLSIIVPTFEEEKCIGTTLRRLKSELSIRHEIIVSDGGSRDSTVTIARQFADQVVLANGTTRQTISQGRNAGAEVARGDFFFFTDADCTIPDADTFFRTALSHFAADGNLVGLTGPVRVVPERETVMDWAMWSFMNAVMRLQNNVRRRGDSAGGEFQMVRREAFLAIGGYREELVTWEDRDLFRRLARIGRTMFEPRLFVFHSGRRVHQVGWSRTIVLWLTNALFFCLRGKAFSKEWRPVR